MQRDKASGGLFDSPAITFIICFFVLPFFWVWAHTVYVLAIARDAQMPHILVLIFSAILGLPSMQIGILLMFISPSPSHPLQVAGIIAVIIGFSAFLVSIFYEYRLASAVEQITDQATSRFVLLLPLIIFPPLGAALAQHYIGNHLIGIPPKDSAPANTALAHNDHVVSG